MSVGRGSDELQRPRVRWHATLAPTIVERGRAVHEGQVLDVLLDDLAGATDPRSSAREGSVMPIYEYRCRACGHTLEELRPADQADAPVECGCGRSDTTRLLSLVARNSSGSLPLAGGSSGGGGGGCCGGGCCG